MKQTLIGIALAVLGVLIIRTGLLPPMSLSVLGIGVGVVLVGGIVIPNSGVQGALGVLWGFVKSYKDEEKKPDA